MNAIVARPVNSAKKFVRNHKLATAVIVTVTTVAVLEKVGLNQHDDFLKEHGLYETFYNLNEI